MWKELATCRSTSFNVQDLLPDREYKFRVRAVNVYGTSEPSQESELTAVGEKPEGRLPSFLHGPEINMHGSGQRSQREGGSETLYVEGWQAVPLLILIFKTVLLTHTLKEIHRASPKLISRCTESVVQWQNTFLGYGKGLCSITGITLNEHIVPETLLPCPQRVMTC